MNPQTSQVSETCEVFAYQMPPHSNVLDAACGTGKYWPMLLARGMQVKGIDQSSEMLRRASQKHPQVPVEKRGLQENDEREACEGDEYYHLLSQRS